VQQVATTTPSRLVYSNTCAALLEVAAVAAPVEVGVVPPFEVVVALFVAVAPAFPTVSVQYKLTSVRVLRTSDCVVSVEKIEEANSALKLSNGTVAEALQYDEDSALISSWFKNPPPCRRRQLLHLETSSATDLVKTL
jgi:hypothetical protein